MKICKNMLGLLKGVKSIKYNYFIIILIIGKNIFLKPSRFPYKYET